jgi:GT2 family glycosyltransferase
MISANSYEVIVTDDGKENNAQAFVQDTFHRVKWTEGPQKGPAANRNNGARHAAGEWLVFIDDDCLPDPNLLRAYTEAIANNPGTLAFEGAIMPDSWKLLKKDMAECPVNTEGGCFWSANICIQKQLFEKIGGFDERFLIAAQEDQDIYRRLEKHTKICFLPKCIVIHPVRIGSLGKKMKALKLQFSNWLYYQEKYTSTPASSHLLKAMRDYVRYSVREALKLNLKTSFLYIFTSMYCLRLVLKK